MKTLLSWSSGKDSAWALHVLRGGADVEVVGLLTTINAVAGRVAMHAVREELLDQQAAALGLPVVKLRIPSPCSNDRYDAVMAAAMERARADGIEAIAFGDLFLEDVRRYREQRLEPTGVTAVFPLWGRPTAAVAREMVEAGMRAVITCVDPRQLDPGFAGRTFDAAFLSGLPATVDPCGENGEFHTFAFAGPMFSSPLPVEPGIIVERDGFVFADLQLATSPPDPMPPWIPLDVRD
ncbi:MAG TPA: hypothetical protein VGK32_12210 [Vicinamibacterales bacterium]|jgi:uncharacterized protein (TIGR00290 family)